MSFLSKKKDGGLRFILAPSRPLKARQRWILKNILHNRQISSYAHGFCPGRSIVTNATLHIKYKYTICADIKDFFPTIKVEQVETVFQDLGYSSSASKKLASLCCHNGILPQGAPTSPCLSNIIFKKLDARIAEWADLCHATYTRYADDITISANEDISHLISILHQELLSDGYSLNISKIRYFDPNQPKRITGLIVQDAVHVPKHFKRKLRQEIYYCKRFGVSTHLNNIRAEKRVHFKEHMYGRAYYIKMVEPVAGTRFLKELSEIDWPE